MLQATNHAPCSIDKFVIQYVGRLLILFQEPEFQECLYDASSLASCTLAVPTDHEAFQQTHTFPG